MVKRSYKKTLKTQIRGTREFNIYLVLSFFLGLLKTPMGLKSISATDYCLGVAMSGES